MVESTTVFLDSLAKEGVDENIGKIRLFFRFFLVILPNSTKCNINVKNL